MSQTVLTVPEGNVDLTVKVEEEKSVAVETTAETITAEVSEGPDKVSTRVDGKTVYYSGVAEGTGKITVKGTAADEEEGSLVLNITVTPKEATQPVTQLQLTGGSTTVTVAEDAGEQTYTFETNATALSSATVDAADLATAVVEGKNVKLTPSKSGNGTLTVKATADDSTEATLVITLNITAKGEEEVEPLTEDDVNGKLASEDFDYDAVIGELDKAAPLKYQTAIALIESYIRKYGIGNPLQRPEEIALAHYDLYITLKDYLEDVAQDDAKFKNIFTILNKSFVKYKDKGLSYNYLVRGVNQWVDVLKVPQNLKDEAEWYKSLDQAIKTYSALLELLTNLSDHTTRDTNKGTKDYKAVIDADGLDLSDDVKTKIKTFYGIA